MGKAVPFNAPLISNSELQLNSYGLADTLSFIEDRLQLTLGVRYQEVESSNLFVPTSTLTKYKRMQRHQAPQFYLKRQIKFRFMQTTSRA